MDGAYNVSASVNRSNIACLSAIRGVDSRILGFSWNSNPNIYAKKALKRAGDSGVRIFARDPVSHKRLALDGITNVEQASDIVFSAHKYDQIDIAKFFPKGIHSNLVLINVSGLIGSTWQFGGLDSYIKEYEIIVRKLLSNNFSILLVPHVVREGAANDMPFCRELYARFKSEDVALVDRVLTPAEVRGLVRLSVLTVTGRMHMAIISLSQNVPAITLATQGKVEGLYRLIGTPDMCINPVSGFGRVAAELALYVTENKRKLISDLSLQLPDVFSLSSKNFHD